MSWWDDILSDIADWGSDVWDSLAGFTDEVAKGYAWIGEGIGTLARAFYDAIIAYGEKIWDAFYNGFSFLRNGLMDLGNGIWVGLTRLGEYLKLGLDALWGALSWIGTQIFSFGKWLWAGISWIGSQVYNFGSWLWDALTWLGETVWDGLKWVGGNLWAGLKAFGQWTWSGVCWLGAQTAKLTKWMWDSITGFFKNLYDTVRTWMGGLTTGVNSWMSGLLGNYKDKIDDILFANMMVLGSKNIIVNLTEKAGDAKSLGEVGYHVLGSVGSGIALPIVGWIMKEVLAMTVKGVGGTDVKLFPPESDGLKYMPEFAYTSDEVPVEDRDPYRETTPQFDSGFTPGIVHAKPAAGTPPGTPVCGECPPSELFMPPGTPIPPDPPYVPPEPEVPVPPEPPFAKSISLEIKGGVPSPVVIPEAYYEIPVTVGGGAPSPGFIGMSEITVGVGGGLPTVEASLWAVQEFVHDVPEGVLYTDICICESGLPVIVYMDRTLDSPNLNWLRHAVKKEGVWYVGLQTPQVNYGWFATCACANITQLIKTASYWNVAAQKNPEVQRQISCHYPTTPSDFQNSEPESVGDIGSQISLALDSLDHEHLSYSDIVAMKLKYAHWDGAAWNIEMPDSPIYSGFETAIACDGLEPHILHYISYPTTKVRHIWKTGGGWIKESIEEGTPGCGRWGAITIDSIGQPHVAYLCGSNLKYAYKDGAGWHIEVVESIGLHPGRLSIATNSSNQPYIVYYESDSKTLKMAHKSNGSFIIETLDSDGTDVGTYPSIVIDASNYLHISYGKTGGGGTGLWYLSNKPP
ncbi:hypothetical protein KAX02_03645 [candidate division WOR-3 bacterium]|nr:hypothetical protein [candidate division WOR-3 bacterium]